MNESKEVVKEREKEFKEQILNRHKNYRRAAWNQISTQQLDNPL